MLLDRSLPLVGLCLGLALTASAEPATTTSTTSASAERPLLTGKAAMGDWTTDAPGVRRKLTLNDLPAPYDTKSVDRGPKIVPRPEGAWPKVPEGFEVNLFAEKLRGPRIVRTAPNGDLFVAESRANRIRVLRDTDGDGKADVNEVFVDDLNMPFGIAFYPPGDNPTHVYIANTNSVVRYAYNNGDLKATGDQEMIVNTISGGGELRGGGHWTRDIVFSADGKKLYVSIGSLSNVDDGPAENIRARIYEFTPDGKNERLFAHGIRNPVGIAFHPTTGELWTSVNERDGLGDHLVPDYVTSVKDGGFYGWPWYYMGGHQDPRHKGKHPELKEKVITPDVLVQSHSASLGMDFYDGQQFPQRYRHNAFSALHGSWNRERRTGYKVIHMPLKDGKSNGEYEDFMTGFVADMDHVWGRPVAVDVAKDGSMYVSDDGGNVIWRISYKK